MQYWLFKSEPETWSWDDQVKKGGPQEWDGVRNYAARLHMRNMKVGDLGFFYHSGGDREIVGTVHVAAEAHQDSTTDDERWECVDIEAVEPFKTPVTLDQIKNDPRFKDMALVRIGRLSVQPVTKDEWAAICQLGGAKT
jgi:predicted RNA-binding protein with PUA-like domain